MYVVESGSKPESMASLNILIASLNILTETFNLAALQSPVRRMSYVTNLGTSPWLCKFLNNVIALLVYPQLQKPKIITSNVAGLGEWSLSIKSKKMLLASSGFPTLRKQWVKVV
uniref:Uncharacterized protein n=1 Tax=Cucumis sativus TaxID=3659 RepID=A0A0A0KRN2_CUCSA